MVPKVSSNPLNHSRVEKETNKIPKEYIEIAEGMEAQFVDMLFNEMNRSIAKESPESSAETYYNSLINYERAQKAAKTGEGLGLKKLILDQIYPHSSPKPLRAKNDNIEIASQDVRTKLEK